MSNAWMLRPYPHDTLRINEFLSKNIVAIGWPGIGDLTGTPREQLKTILSNPPYNYSSLKLGNVYGTIDIVVNQMQVDDLVIVPNDNEIHFCQIKSDYFYDLKLDNNQDGYPHQRQVVWLKMINRKDLPMELRSSLKAQQTATNLTKHYETIKSLAYGNPLPIPTSTNITSSYVSVDYPLRPDVMVTVSIPKDITKTESERLGDFIKTIYFQ